MDEGEHEGDGRQESQKNAGRIVFDAHKGGGDRQQDAAHQEDKRAEPVTRAGKCFAHDRLLFSFYL